MSEVSDRPRLPAGQPAAADRSMTHAEVLAIIQEVWDRHGLAPRRLSVLLGARCNCGCERWGVGVADKDTRVHATEFLSWRRDVAARAAIVSLADRIARGKGDVMPPCPKHQVH